MGADIAISAHCRRDLEIPLLLEQFFSASRRLAFYSFPKDRLVCLVQNVSYPALVIGCPLTRT